jgi:hypothetical protein
MKLPNGDYAVVEIEKLRDYCLSPDHPRGRHKARVFKSVLGLTTDEAEILREALLHAARTEAATEGLQDQYGQRYVLDFVMSFGNNEATVRSAWIILANDDVPRLTSCYVL